MAVTREQIVQLILVEHLTEAEAADRLGVHKNTIARAKKLYDIDVADWWKYQKVFCKTCGKELDPEVKLDSKARKLLINRKNPRCEDCRIAHQKEYGREKQAEWRDNHRDDFNAYMRKWREENKERWKEIKAKSMRKSQEG